MSRYPVYRRLAITSALALLMTATLAMGKTDMISRADIQLPNSPTVTESFAAEELKRYLERILKTPVPIADANEFPSAEVHRFYVGRTAESEFYREALKHEIRDMEIDSFVITHSDEFSVLRGGGDRGTLYAVYEFLESVGCRWFEPGPEREIVPQVSEIGIRIGTEFKSPSFAVREIGLGDFKSVDQGVAVIDWAVKNRLNRLFSVSAYRTKEKRYREAWAKRGGEVHWQHICHNYPWMLPNSRYFAKHPEYYSLYHGQRIPIGKEGGNICTTHPGVRDVLTRYAKDWFSAYDGGSVIPLCPPDGDIKWCECPDCLALGGRNFVTGPDGHMTRRQVEVINHVAERVREQFPDRYLLNLAYSRYVWPYPGMRTEPNVIVQVCHGYAGNGYQVHSIDAPCNREARKIFQQWADSGAGGIGIWDYFILQVPNGGGSPLTPLGFTGVANDMIKFLAELEPAYKVYFTQAGTELWQSNAFLYYTIARMTWDADTSLRRLRKDYARRVFGEAAGPIIDYLAALDKTYAKADWYPTLWRHITVPSPAVFTPRFLSRAEALLARAERELDEDNVYGRESLTRMQNSLRYATHAVRPKQLIAAADGVWRLERREHHYRFNAGKRRVSGEEIAKFREEARQEGILDLALEKVLFRSHSRKEPIVWLKNDRVAVAVLPGVGGRIIRIIDRESGRNVLHEPKDDLRLPEPGVGYVRYGGYEEYLGKAFAAPGWEIPMTYEASKGDNGGQRLLLRGRVDDYLLVREVTIKDGDDSRVVITNTVTNESKASREFVHRVHPEFQLGETLDSTELVVNWGTAQQSASPLAEAAANSEHAIQSNWGVVNRQAKYGVIHHFDPARFATHLHVDWEHQTFNLELFKKVTTLAPGASSSFTHAYQLLGEREFAGNTRAAVIHEQPVEAADDASSAVTYVPGIRGTGARMNADAHLQYPGVPALCDRSGTFACWFKLDPASSGDAPLMSAGVKQPDWMVLAIREQELVFYRRRGAAPYQGANAAWFKLSCDISSLDAGVFHHAAVVWSVPPNEPAVVKLYVNGICRAARYDARILPFANRAALGIGHLTANVKGGRFPGVLDEVRVWSYPLLDDEVQQVVLGDRAGKETALPAAILRLPFNQSTRSEVRPRSTISKAEIQRRHAQVKKVGTP